MSGDKNSSLTRVQPIFKKLYNIDKTGKLWLPKLLSLGNRSNSNIQFHEFGELIKEPVFEFSANPSVSFLKWIINNIEKLNKSRKKQLSTYSKITEKKRKALFSGNIKVKNEALHLLNNKSLPSQAWYRFEGPTRVDCALFTKNSVIFIEGKRTEIGPSKNIFWYNDRNQVLRNLDCVQEYAKKNKIKYFFVLLIVEDSQIKGSTQRKNAIKDIYSQDIILKSLPHLNNTEREEIMKHYLGYTTWEKIIKTFNLKFNNNDNTSPNTE